MNHLEFVSAEIVKLAHKIHMLDSLSQHMPQHRAKFDLMIKRYEHQIDDLIGAIHD